MDAKEFRKAYEASGLTQAQYAKQVGMSPSMVSYYLKKTKTSNASQSNGKFTELVVDEPANGVMKITTPSGVQIEIPL